MLAFVRSRYEQAEQSQPAIARSAQTNLVAEAAMRAADEEARASQIRHALGNDAFQRG